MNKITLERFFCFYGSKRELIIKDANNHAKTISHSGEWKMSRNLRSFSRALPRLVNQSKPEGKTFALKVRGESMIEDGILDRDYVIIEQTVNARNGDIIVALIDNQNATLKRFYNEKDNIRLQPANKTMKPTMFNKN